MYHSEVQPRPDRWEHQVAIPPDDGKPVVFKWHWPRGTFDKRMSAYEIAAFLMPHMPSILPLLDKQNHPRVYAEFEAMLLMLATSPLSAIDRVLPWIQPVLRTEEDELIVLNLFAQVDCEPTKKIFYARAGTD